MSPIKTEKNPRASRVSFESHSTRLSARRLRDSMCSICGRGIIRDTCCLPATPPPNCARPCICGCVPRYRSSSCTPYLGVHALVSFGSLYIAAYYMILWQQAKRFALTGTENLELLAGDHHEAA